MNELEKQSTEPAAQPLETAGEQLVEKTDVCTNSGSENENPCEIESSPALDIAEAADEFTEKTVEEKKEPKAADEQPKEINFHHLSKTELKDILKDILSNGEMERHKDVTAIKQAFYALHNKQILEEQEKFISEGNDAEAFESTPDPDEIEIKELLVSFREKRNQYLEEKEEEKRKNLEAKKKIIEEINNLSEDIDNINLHYQKFQQLQQDFKAIGEVPATDDSEVWKSYQTAIEQFYDRLKLNKELRDLDFKKNLELKTLLVEKAKGLAELPDPVEAFRILQSLHQQWREIGPVAREIREEIWNNFKDATTVVNKRHQDYFQDRKANEQANEEAKTALCEKAEAINLEELKNFNDWDKATKEILALQQDWKQLGFASRKVNNQLFNRFRKTCDEFFAAKAEYFKKTKEESKENLAKKEALCEKAEALLDRAQEKSAFDEMQAIREEWRTIGVVRRKQGDEIWKRFCAAVDAFFDARKSMFSEKRDEENANLTVKKEIIEKLKNIGDDAEKSEVMEMLRELRDLWRETGFVPFKYKEEINRQYKEELDRIHKAFDIRENRQRMRRFENEIKKMEGDDSKLGRERDKLVRAIEARQLELKTIENNIGFFKMKSSAGNSMLKDFEKKIEKIKEEISQIREKIKLLDNQPKED